jgi:hypothetical protein
VVSLTLSSPRSNTRIGAGVDMRRIPQRGVKVSLYEYNVDEIHRDVDGRH